MIKIIYYLTEGKTIRQNALSKARADVLKILAEQGLAPLEVNCRWDRNEGLGDKLSALFSVVRDWASIARRSFGNDVLIISYPLPVQAKAARFSIPYIKKIKNQGVRVVLFVHDLDSIRFASHFNNDQQFVALADAVIVHTDAMAEIVRTWTRSPVIILSIFDYLIDGALPACVEGIDVAGNLSPEKAGWIYRASEGLADIPLNLYGSGCDGAGSLKAWYRGSFSPDELISHMTGRFGLVWDGSSVNTCAEGYGEYLRINSPHKLSLYLALGKPVFIWADAAQAQFVTEHGVGIAVRSLREVPDLYESVDDEEYSRMRSQALVLSSRLRSGWYTKKAVADAFEAIGVSGR